MTCIKQNDQLRVILSEAETVKYNIDCVFFECGSKKAEKALTSVLKIAADETGFKSNAIKFIIEIYPVFDGGCEIFFIPESDRAKRKISATIKKKIDRFLLFEFDFCEAALSAIEILYLNSTYQYIKSSLFERNGSYRLLLDKGKNEMPKNFFEFAKKELKGNMERVKTIEHWKAICEDCAIEKIGSALCQKRK